MEKTIRVRARRAFMLPNGTEVQAGTELRLTQTQAKYLLIARKIEKVEQPAQPAAVKIEETGSAEAAAEKPAAKGVKK